MIGKAVKNVSSAVTRAAQSAPKPAPKPAYKLPPVRLPAVRSPAPSFKEGGATKEPKAMMKKEVSFMKKKGAPKSMIKHEKAEYGMKRGGLAAGHKAADGIAKKGKTKAMAVKMAKGGKAC